MKAKSEDPIFVKRVKTQSLKLTYDFVKEKHIEFIA